MSNAIDMQDLNERFDRLVVENMRRECEEIRQREDTHDEWRRLNEDR